MLQIQSKMNEVDRQLATEVGIIKSSLKGAFEASRSQEEQMRKQIADLRTEVLDLQKRGQPVQFPQARSRQQPRDLRSAPAALQRGRHRRHIGATNVFVIDRAEVPTTPSSPHLLSNLVVSFILGTIAALFGASCSNVSTTP